MVSTRPLPPVPQQALSKDGTVDSGAVEQLLSEKLVQGYLLLEKACPSCATPLVKQQLTNTQTQQRQQQPHGIDQAMSLASSMESNGNSNHKTSKQIVIPIAGVPFCVWCQAHVVTDQTEVRELESVSSRLKVRGSIMVQGGLASLSTQDDDDDDDGMETDDDGREEQPGAVASYKHMATLDSTTPKPYDEKSTYNKQKMLETIVPGAPSMASMALTSKTTNSILDKSMPTAMQPAKTNHIDTPHPPIFGTFMSSIFNGNKTAANDDTTKPVTAQASVATDKATAASASPVMHDRITDQRRAFDFDQSPTASQRKCSSNMSRASPRSRRSARSCKSRGDDSSTDDYEEIEVVHVDDDNQTTLSELEQKILSNEQAQLSPTSCDLNDSQAGVEHIHMIMSDVSEQPPQNPQLTRPLLSAHASSITASMMMMSQQQPVQLHAMASQATDAMQKKQEEGGIDGQEVEHHQTKIAKTIAEEPAITSNLAVGKTHSDTSKKHIEESKDADDDKDDDDDGSKCTVSIEHNFDMVELAHISEDEDEPMPAYDKRRDIATKVLGAKMIQGFTLTELQCNKCLMPLMEKNASYFCVVCPVLKKKFKESLASLGDDLTEASHKSRMQNSAGGSHMQSSAGGSRHPSSAGGSRVSIHAAGETQGKIALLDEDQAQLAAQAEAPTEKVTALDAINEKGPAPNVRLETLAAIQEQGTLSSSSVSGNPKIDIIKAATNAPLKSTKSASASQENSVIANTSVEKFSMTKDHVEHLNANNCVSPAHSKPHDIHAALSPKSAISKLTSVGSASHYNTSFAPAVVPKTVSTPIFTKAFAPQQLRSKPFPGVSQSVASSNKGPRYLTPKKESKIPWESLKISTSPVPSESTIDIGSRCGIKLAPKTQTADRMEPTISSQLFDKSPGSTHQPQTPILQAADATDLSKQPTSRVSYADTGAASHGVQSPVKDSDVPVVLPERQHMMSSSQSQGTETEVVNDSASKHSHDSEKTYDTVPEHLLELRKLNQLADNNSKRPDAPANTLVRSIKSGLVLSTPYSDDAREENLMKNNLHGSNNILQLEGNTDAAASTLNTSVDESAPSQEFSVRNEKLSDSKIPAAKDSMSSAAKEEEARTTSITEKAAKEMRRRRGNQVDLAHGQLNDITPEKKIDGSVDGSSSLSNVEAACVTLLSEDIKSIQTAANTALAKADQNICLQEAMQLVVNPFAQLEDGYNDIMSLSPPSRKKRKELEKQAAALFAEAEAADFESIIEKTPSERQNRLESALAQENLRAHQESKRIENLERRYGEQMHREHTRGVLQGLTSHVKALFGENERSLLDDISKSVRARKIAEAEAQRLGAELHALQEECKILKMHKDADQRARETAVADQITEKPASLLNNEIATARHGSKAMSTQGSEAMDLAHTNVTERTNAILKTTSPTVVTSASHNTLDTVHDELARAIAVGDASVVAEVESIVRSQAEDYHDETEAASRIEDYWETLRVEGRAVMTRRLMGGWILLKQTCQGRCCEGRPLLLDDDNNRHCVVCGGSGSGFDGVYALPSVAEESTMRDISLPEEIQTPCFEVGVIKKDLGHMPSTSYLDEISHDLGEHVMKTVWNGPSEINVENYETKRDFVSKEIGKRMLKGWTLLQASCPQCTMPLMTDLDKRKEICVLCGVVGLAAQTCGSVISNATSNLASFDSAKSKSIGAMHEVISGRLKAANSKDSHSRIQLKKTLIRELVMEEAKKAAGRLTTKMQAPGQKNPSDAISWSNSSLETSKQGSRSMDPSNEEVSQRQTYFTTEISDAFKPSSTRSSVPEWLAGSRRVKDASVSPARTRVANSVSGRISIDPLDTTTQGSKENNTIKRAEPELNTRGEQLQSLAALRESKPAKPILSPANQSTREPRGDPPALQGYAVGRKQAIDADATYSIVQQRKIKLLASPESPSELSRDEIEASSPSSRTLTIEMPHEISRSDENSILKLIETAKGTLTVDTGTRRDNISRAEPSPGMSQLTVPGSRRSYGHSTSQPHRSKQSLSTSESLAADMPFSSQEEEAVDGSSGGLETQRTRALASPGMFPVRSPGYCVSPNHTSSSDDSIDPPASFQQPAAFRRRSYKSTMEMKKVLRGTNSFLARQSVSSQGPHSAVVQETESFGKESQQRQDIHSDVPENNLADQGGILKSFLGCGPVGGDQNSASPDILSDNRTGRSVASTRPRITPESSARQNIGSYRASLSSASGDIRALSGKTSGSTKISSLTPETGSSREISEFTSQDNQMSPVFSVDQIVIPANRRTDDIVKKVPADSGLSTNSDDIFPRATSARADDGEEPLELHENESVVIDVEPLTPRNITMTGGTGQSPNNFVLVGGPLDLTDVPDEEVYDVSDMYDEDDADFVRYGSDGLPGMSGIRDEDIFGSQYHMKQHPDIASLGSSTLDAVLARIDDTKRQLEQAPSGDSGRLRQLIENLAEAASDIEKEDLLDQQSRRSHQPISTPQQKSRFLCR
ncbi:hypothetical protein MPSEU_000758500 [Mayamaea pseudoterrestris]|nr:hypothetical protein MPSEU_000758500 [Mayamaea pseudoterrestris]